MHWGRRKSWNSPDATTRTTGGGNGAGQQMPRKTRGTGSCQCARWLQCARTLGQWRQVASLLASEAPVPSHGGPAARPGLRHRESRREGSRTPCPISCFSDCIQAVWGTKQCGRHSGQPFARVTALVGRKWRQFASLLASEAPVLQCRVTVTRADGTGSLRVGGRGLASHARSRIQA